MVVEEIMSKDPFALDVRATVEEALAQLAEADIRHLPIIESGALVGILSDRDLREAVPGGLWSSSPVLGEAVSSIMSGNVVSATPETDLGEVVDAMIEHKIGAVPVVEADSAKLIGIVSYVDVLRALREFLE
ncbi:MAG TPA: CBS domain-containing protein [Candidatus Krumholzibacteria bacterium]|jgi:acetoin utilization protein AcuB